jgi:hypothetical protein
VPPPIQPTPPPAQPPVQAQPPQQQPPTWGQPPPAYPPPAYPPPQPWAEPTPDEPTDDAAEEKRGVRGELPLGRRGQLAFDTASFTSGDGNLSALSMVLDTRFPIAKTTFVDARLPLGYAMGPGGSGTVLGNAMIGAHYVGRTGSKRTWWSVGGGFGLPLLIAGPASTGAAAMATVPRALWDLHEYTPEILPFNVDIWVETHIGDATLFRFEIEPVTTFPLGGGEEVELAIQHAAEIQFGHAIGGGLRLQGTAFPTFEETDNGSLATDDLYQLAFEPFFVIERRSAFLRTGLMIPVDEVVGPPFASVSSDNNSGLGNSGLSDGLGAWGFRLTAGMRIE